MSERTKSDSEVDLGGEDDSTFSTDTARANIAIERGLGVGAAELAAQRDPDRDLSAEHLARIERDTEEDDA